MTRRDLLFAASSALAGTDPTWTFSPPRDDFSPDAPLDLRYLNEPEAGRSGFVRVDDAGRFVLGDGRPARFWAVNTTVGREKPWTTRPLWTKAEPDLAHHARFLAKRGVNMVRCHAYLNPDARKQPDARLTDINTAERDWIWRTVAAMKKEGIYTTISPYFPLQMRFRPEWDLPGGAAQNPHAMLFLEPKLQAAYRSWLRQLYGEVNPHTRLRLADDPAVALIQLQNEDSLLFWTFSGIAGVQKDNLRRLFGSWAVRKHGSLAAARKSWDADLPADDPDAGLLDVYPIFDLTRPQRGGKAKRIADQTRFMAETMHDLYRGFEDFLRKEVGCRQLINAGNWKTADAVRLNDIERWAYTANQVSATNRYTTGLHQGDERSRNWSVREGDTFTDPSILEDPSDFALNLKQTEGMPMILTEGLWVQPHRYMVEGPFLIAAYQCLTGVQGYYWFSTAADEWAPPQSANGYQASLAKFEFARPDTLGMFPAAALLYRAGYVKEGEPVVREVRSPESLWERRTPVIVESPTYDPNRDAGDMSPASGVRTGVHPRAFLAGPVRVRYGGNEADTRVADLKGLVSPDAKRVRSNTGELLLDAEARACTIDTPKAQGVCAFFAGKQYRLGAVTIRCENDYAAILAVSLDGKPLASSARVLVQIGTQAFPTGWKTEPVEMKAKDGRTFSGAKLLDIGKAPWQIVKARGEVEVRNPTLKRARALTPNGTVKEQIAAEASGGKLRFALPPDALYVVLDRG